MLGIPSWGLVEGMTQSYRIALAWKLLVLFKLCETSCVLFASVRKLGALRVEIRPVAFLNVFFPNISNTRQITRQKYYCQCQSSSCPEWILALDKNQC